MSHCFFQVFQDSRNFDPTGGFDALASLTSLNMQGRSLSGRAKLSGYAMRGGLAPVADRCCRDRAQTVEATFVRHGYDGYMKKDEWARLRPEVTLPPLAATAQALLLPRTA